MTTNSDIAKRAYELWEQSGRPEGRDVEIWLKAEAEARNQEPASQSTRAQPLLKGAKARRAVS
jgi:hypothetical protein